MDWLWTLPPLVVTGTAVVVLGATGRLSRLHRNVVDDRRSVAASTRLGDLEDHLEGLRGDLDRWCPPDGDRDARPTER